MINTYFCGIFVQIQPVNLIISAFFSHSHIIKYATLVKKKNFLNDFAKNCLRFANSLVYNSAPEVEEHSKGMKCLPAIFEDQN